jgi:hypothetical protein
VHPVAIVVEDTGVILGAQGVALGTTHHDACEALGNVVTGDLAAEVCHDSCCSGRDSGVPAGPPASHDPGVEGLVAHQAGLRGFAQRRVIGRHRKGEHEDTRN